jgi:hypothetical protein
MEDAGKGRRLSSLGNSLAWNSGVGPEGTEVGCRKVKGKGALVLRGGGHSALQGY